MYRFVPAVSGFRWMSLDREKGQNPNWISDLQHSLDFGGSPWKVEVERAMGIEPTAQAWEAWVLPLYDARKGRHSMRYCSWVQPFWKTRECTAPLFDPFKR